MCKNGPNTNIAWLFKFKWSQATNETWTFQMGVDFGFGHAVWHNGKYIQGSTANWWWGGNWASSHKIVISKNFAAGSHEISIYGHENGNDGAMDIRFKRGNDNTW